MEELMIDEQVVSQIMDRVQSEVVRAYDALVGKGVHRFGDVVKDGEAFGAAGSGDIKVLIDDSLSQAAVAAAAALPQVGLVLHEDDDGKGQEFGSGSYRLDFDGCDGSGNARAKGSAVYGGPFCFSQAVIPRRDNVCFGDVLGCAVVDLQSRDAWKAWRSGSNTEVTFNGAAVHLTGKTELNLGRQIVYADTWYEANRMVAALGFPGDGKWIRSLGSAIREYANIASGQAVGAFSLAQKQDVLAAASLLIEGSGGVIVGLEKSADDSLAPIPLAEMPYDFRGQMPVVAGASQEVVDRLLEGINSALVRLRTLSRHDQGIRDVLETLGFRL